MPAETKAHVFDQAQVNRISVVNLRHVLYMFGKHPPRFEGK